MFKMFVRINWLIIFCLYSSFLAGFDKQLHDVGGVIAYESDWRDLFIAGHDIDFKAAALAHNQLKGGHYDKNLHAVIPADIPKTELEWKKAKDRIAHMIGPLPLLFGQDSHQWVNSSKNVDHLLRDANLMAPCFKEDFQYIAYVTGGTAHFGLEDRNIVKTRESLVNKVKRDAKALGLSEEEAVSKIGDALRGTIIVDDVDKIPLVVAEILNYVDYKDAQVIFKNLWAEDRESGYVGIHAKILLPIVKGEKIAEERSILAEMQIHLYSIADGTNESVKERAHMLYENVRMENFNPLLLSAASKLLFLTGMQDVIKSLDEK
jgi:hypothetical protein